ncbi:MAG: bifunctional enoyl-CoA hydratase/phosphate acetyltransferase [Bacteroidota bacterium]|nr:bifunctional enoyl-CoA hydratase/phosphate acetyltransferase [Bacteroidota bacterium]
MLSKLSDLRQLVKNNAKKKIALAAAHDKNALEAVFNAAKADLVTPILVGNEEKINEIAKELNINISGVEIINESNPEACAAKAVKLVREKKADILMKGILETSTMLKAVLNKEYGLRTGNLLSHIAFFEMPTYHKVIAVADAAMNIAPDFNEKVGIIKNSVSYMRRIGYDNPKVAILAAVETVKDIMLPTMEAAAISKMAERGQIKNCIIDGPLALDNAVCKESALHKGINSEVSGDVDLLIVPNIEAGNVLYKSFIFFAKANVAAVILGATAPIVLTSRSDSNESKLDSITLAAAAN